MKLIKVGRADACNLRFPSPNVSSLHAEILILDDGKVVITDTNSTNGTYVGNERLQPGKEYEVRRGDLVRFADCELNWAQVPQPDRNANMVQVYNVGSNYRNNIIVDDPYVSRFHCTVKIDKKKNAFIRDNGSRNGTHVNGVKITAGKDVPVKRGDTFTLGNKDVTDQITEVLPKKSSILKWMAICGGAAACLAAVIIGLFSIIGPDSCFRTSEPVPPTEARQAVVYVQARYMLLARVEDSPISDDIWTAVIKEFYGNDQVRSGELPVGAQQYNATAFFVDREGRMATNRHVALPWDLNYMSPDLAKSIRSTVDSYISDQQLPEQVVSMEHLALLNEAVGRDPRFSLWKMVYTQTVREYNNGNERNPVAYINSLIRQLRKAKVTVDGRLLEIMVGYPGRNYTHVDEYERCTVLKASDNPEIDLALLQLNSKKTPDNIPFVFEPSTYFTGTLEPLKEEFVWIGYPRGNDWNLDASTKALEPQIRTTKAAKVPSKYNFEIETEAVGGASGSPIYNPKNGQLVGVLWGGWAGASNFGLACQAKYLKQLYEEEVGPVDE